MRGTRLHLILAHRFLPVSNRVEASTDGSCLVIRWVLLLVLDAADERGALSSRIAPLDNEREKERERGRQAKWGEKKSRTILFLFNKVNNGKRCMKFIGRDIIIDL
ncbi:hypothetical protein HAX54_032164 [Datura stramonium]|uniref:Uncharacterized protein n=1 Tax=Datura stramonium TaxID=4076 RepID=A0ABS8VB67_DATST|nr:hypothetical protein [Datura stramonium]